MSSLCQYNKENYDNPFFLNNNSTLTLNFTMLNSYDESNITFI